MQQASSAIQIVFAALLAAVATIITGFILDSWESATLTAVALSTFLGGLLTPYLASLFSTNKSSSSSKPRDTQQSTAPSHHLGSDDTRTLYVGNIPFKTDEDAITELFSQYGVVNAVRLVKDRRTGRKKGYGFVEMDIASAEVALGQLNDSEFEGRTIKVRAAHSENAEE